MKVMMIAVLFLQMPALALAQDNIPFNNLKPGSVYQITHNVTNDRTIPLMPVHPSELTNAGDAKAKLPQVHFFPTEFRVMILDVRGDARPWYYVGTEYETARTGWINSMALYGSEIVEIDATQWLLNAP